MRLLRGYNSPQSLRYPDDEDAGTLPGYIRICGEPTIREAQDAAFRSVACIIFGAPQHRWIPTIIIVPAMKRLALLITLGVILGGCRPAEPPVNVLFILADDLGYMDIGAYNPDTFYETPHVDRLAANGLRFTDAYAAAPVCSPTRTSILTGKYPARTATTDWFGAPQPETVENHWTRDKPLLPASYTEHMPLEEKTLAEAFLEAGYRTFFAGKWHLGGEGYYPEDQGFEINKGGWELGGPFNGNQYFSPYGNDKLEDGPPGEHLPDRLAEETVTFISENVDQPFFAYLSFYSVHTPLMAPEDLVAKYEAKMETAPENAWGEEGDRKVRLVQNHAVYAGMVEAMDRAIGKVLTALDSLDLDDRTIVVFMSDNGGLSTSEGHPTSNLPLRGGKGWLYEGGIREPMLIKWPGVTPAGSVADVPVTSNDFYPTLLEMTGLPEMPDQHMDGMSLVPVLTGGDDLAREALYWHYPHYGNQGGSPGSAVRSGDWKLIHFFEDDRVELYNLRDDISESTDLSERQPALTDSLRTLLQDWRRRVGARYPVFNPDATD